MITVAILINGNVLCARGAVNTLGKRGEELIYKVDTGDLIYHKPEDGAVSLAKKMLDTIKE